MKRYRSLLVLSVLLLVVSGVAPGQSADFGFGIPDMVEEKVDELDEKVRAFKERQPFFEDFRSATVAVSNDTRDRVVGSVITGGGLNNRVFVALEINRPGEEGIALFQSDGEGKPLASEKLASPNDNGEPTFEQISISPSDEQVDVLLNIPTDSGPQGIFFRRNADNNLATPGGGIGGGGIGEVVIGPSGRGDPDTAVEVNTFSYDSDTNDIYLSGDSGVFKVFTDRGLLGPSDWDNKFLEEFEVPEDNLVIDGDKIYVTALEPAGGGNKNLVVKKIDHDSEVLESRPIDAGLSNPRTNLLAGESHLYLHYYSDSVDDWIYRLEYGDLSTDGSNQYAGLSSNFQLQVEGQNRLYGEGTDGKVFGFNKTSLANPPDELTVSDTKVTVTLVDQLGRVYVGTKESAEASVLRAPEDLSDSTTVFPEPGQTFPDECVQDLEDRDNVQTRPVWLKREFLGVVFNRTCLNWDEVNANLPISGWAHEDGNNQRQRRRQP